MCRGSNLGVCCEMGCDERIQCQDTAGYCPAHDPFGYALDDEDATPSPNVADDPEKRRVYDLGRLTRAMPTTEMSIRAHEQRLAEMRARVAALRIEGDS